MERKRVVYKNVSESLNLVAMFDLDYEHNETKHSVRLPIYQCPNTKEYVIFFKPQEDVIIIGKNNDIFEAGNNLRNNLIEHYRQYK